MPDHQALPEMVVAFQKCLAGYSSPSRSESRVHGPRKTDFHFDALKAAKQVDPSWVDAYSRSLGEPLFIIGSASQGYLLLCMGASGKIIGGYEKAEQLPMIPFIRGE